MYKFIKKLISCIFIFFLAVLLNAPVYGQQEGTPLVKDEKTGTVEADKAALEDSEAGKTSVERTGQKEDSIKKEPTGKEIDRGEPKKEKKGIDNKASQEKPDKKIVKEKKTPDEKAKGPSGDKKAVGKTKKPSSGNELLEIREGDFKYKRIPLIKLPEREEYAIEEETFNTSEEEIITSEVIDESEEAGLSDGKEDGIYSIDDKTGEKIIIFVLVFVIIGIVVILKIKSKNRGDRVLRRFPGS